MDIWDRSEPLRVAVVHSYYSSRQTSGENRVVSAQVQAMESSGITVGLFHQATDERETSPLYPIETAITVATGRGRSPVALLKRFAPHVTHVHNLFPNYGRHWVRKWDGPLVATMHNFRPLCPAGTFYRDGRICTDCLDRRSGMPAVRYGCYRDSPAKTLPLALSTRFGDDPLLDRADRIIVLNKTARDLYARAGVPGTRIDIHPNFLATPAPPGSGGGPWVFAGRLTHEKGILELIRKWPRERSLIVIGDGPLREAVTKAAGPGVTLIGDQPGSRVQQLMREAVGVVVPSRWYEAAPLVYIEAMAAGTPVLAWRDTSVGQTVQSTGTGVVAGDDLGQVLALAEATFPTLRTHCRLVFETNYTEDAWLQRTMAIYRRAATPNKPRT